MKKCKIQFKIMTMFIAVVLLFSCMASVVSASTGTFKDVGPNHVFYTFIESLYSKGIINGYREGNYFIFKPGNHLTRGQAAKMIAIGAGLNYEGKKASFPDVSPTHEMSPYIAALVEVGAIRGTSDGTFKMHENITRRQIAQIIVKAFNLKAGNLKVEFKDLPKGEAGEFIKILASNGIVSGYENGTKFKPNDKVTRGQFAKILHLAIEKSLEEKEESRDENKEENKEGKNDKVVNLSIMLDPGHGGKDPGAVNDRLGLREKDFTLSISKKIKERLEKYGYTVLMTRTEDEYISLVERATKANSSKVNIFVSVHINSYTDSRPNGIETLYYPTSVEGKKLATEIQKQLIKDTGATNRGIKPRDDLTVLRRTAMPAVLVELGFISNDEEALKLNTSAYQDTLAKAIATGIKTYFENK